MPISLTCAGCGRKLKAKETLLGRTLPCPGCGTKIHVGSEEDAAAALLLGDSESAAPPVPRKPAAARIRPAASSPERSTRVDGSTTIDRPAPRSDPKKLKPIVSDEVPAWLRHLHWLLILAMIPLALSLLSSDSRGDIGKRFDQTLDELPIEQQTQIGLRMATDKNLSDTQILMLLPEHRLKGAFLARDTLAHWLMTFVAAGVFFAFLFALCSDGCAKPVSLLLVGVFTATVGIVFLFAVQAIAAGTQGRFIPPTSILGILVCIVQLIGLSYSVAMDPSSDFLVSFLGFTFGVGLCEEIVKVIPVLFNHYRRSDDTWRGAYLWGLASGAGFGLAEGNHLCRRFLQRHRGGRRLLRPRHLVRRPPRHLGRLLRDHGLPEAALVPGIGIVARLLFSNPSRDRCADGAARHV